MTSQLFAHTGSALGVTTFMGSGGAARTAGFLGGSEFLSGQDSLHALLPALLEGQPYRARIVPEPRIIPQHINDLFSQCLATGREYSLFRHENPYEPASYEVREGSEFNTDSTTLGDEAYRPIEEQFFGTQFVAHIHPLGWPPIPSERDLRIFAHRARLHRGVPQSHTVFGFVTNESEAEPAFVHFTARLNRATNRVEFRFRASSNIDLGNINQEWIERVHQMAEGVGGDLDISEAGRLAAARDDYEERLDALRVGSLPLPELFRELTALAEEVLRRGLETAWSEILSPKPPSGDFAIVAMGKLGGSELTYHSDLDIIYIYENPDDQEFYTRLGRRILSALSVFTRQGIAYKIDTALRPFGNDGTLVSSLASFQEYHRTMGRTWERQALIKARPLFGRPDRTTDFTKRLHEKIRDIAYQDYDSKKIAEEIDHLRGRMEREIAQERPGRYNLKTGRGGLVDIEFAVQYLQLIHGKKHPSVQNPNTISALRALMQEGLLERTLAETLKEAYFFLRGIETRLRLLLARPADDLIEGVEWLQELEDRYFDGERLLPRLMETREQVRSVYERVLCR